MSCASDEMNRLNGSTAKASDFVASIGKRKGNWRVSGIDPDGIWFFTSSQTARRMGLAGPPIIVRALDDVDVTIHKGEVLGVVGE